MWQFHKYSDILDFMWWYSGNKNTNNILKLSISGVNKIKWKVLFYLPIGTAISDSTDVVN